MASVSASTVTRKRKRIVLANKLKICQLVKGGSTLQSVADKYDVGKSTIHDIMKNKEKPQVFS